MQNLFDRFQTSADTTAPQNHPPRDKAQWRSYILHRLRPWEFLTAPIIYAMIVPFVLIDLFVTVFQWTCFPVYRIPRVRRRDYIAMDRGKLAFLNPLQRLNCIYCEYCNGVAAYVQEVTGRTEYYWCPIKHARKLKNPHRFYGNFIDHDDGARWDAEFFKLKEDARACEGCAGCGDRPEA
ncbi:hypothetical protein AQS8620_02666 [Aquimixticola soesokkakensis]|uniref:Uncharacterized protein n=1 Tax=Aquimixticola soesokkakensis TaxID=1519096 RepID=A0A1Y5TAP2_9RHOB|nr:hypothetical protein [Aquimixticola soesokkakensis]SLN59640.1 hypothetical protein AQS8620_02666 [Aquimixticola soesokkakensis]